MPKMNTIGGHEIRSLAHGLFGNIDRVAIREAIKNFCSSGSLTTFVFEIGEVIQTAEQMKFIAALKEFLPRDLQADFAALCRMNIRGYKDFLKGKPPETDRRSKRTPPDIYTTSYKTSRRPAIPRVFMTFPSFGSHDASLPQPTRQPARQTYNAGRRGTQQMYHHSEIERLDSQGESQDYESADKSSTVRTVTSVIRFRPANQREWVLYAACKLPLRVFCKLLLLSSIVLGKFLHCAKSKL